MRKSVCVHLFLIGVVAVILMGGSEYMAARTSAKDESIEMRLRRLEDREEILRLLRSYGQFLDKRDFNNFSQLFSETEGEWIGGMGRAKGSAAIRKLMEASIGTGSGKSAPPNYHIFTNEVIDVKGNRADAVSKWMFVVQNDARPQLALLGHYEDTLVREDGRWKFLRRTVYSDIPPDDPVGR